ncbi:hypothetical protein I302_108892 [Kwoniella bestiolae CBS 10118]|uniref:Uncharacterized protein n=1 Tax=Kwoniella bestiolae CBS 10118 TaxID=1296100 RepID=A0A1B9FUD7_9TREE|nr:hypothetical protein I302_08029 [Kwoniella bestiolae CBS 10118]OCF22382.1 hypothetical protein I302_08029 [Kwoniella bestiolae CBS 10118]
MSENASILSCLPPNLDQNDPDACDRFAESANDQQLVALMVLMLRQTDEICKHATKACDDMSNKLQRMNTNAVYSIVVAEGGPLPPPVEVNGKTCPDDMSEQSLDQWLIFHGRTAEDIQRMDHFDKAKLLFVLLGGTMNDSLRRYQNERDRKRKAEIIDLTDDDQNQEQESPRKSRRSCTTKP